MFYVNGEIAPCGRHINNFTPTEDEIILEARMLLADRYQHRVRVQQAMLALKAGPPMARMLLRAMDFRVMRRETLPFGARVAA